MRSPEMGNRHVPGSIFALDNGVFGTWQRNVKRAARGLPPLEHDVARWLRWVDKQPREGCLFVVAPDVIGDAWGSFDRGYPYFSILRMMGFKVALVAQEGFDLIEDDRWDWDAFDVLFIGGTPAARRGGPEWKTCGTDPLPCWSGDGFCITDRPPDVTWRLGAEWAIREAKRHGKWVHVGRVNSLRRLRLMATWGADSADGTCFIRARSDNERLHRWIAEANRAATIASHHAPWPAADRVTADLSRRAVALHQSGPAGRRGLLAQLDGRARRR